jgi:hypothetical protein
MKTKLLSVVSLCLMAMASVGTASAQVSCSGLPAFASCTAYATGTSVTYNGSKYTAIAPIPNNRDCPPNSPFNPSNDNWWVNNGTCGGATPTATTGATPTATATRTNTPVATPTTGPGTIVSLSSAYNVNAAYSDGTTFSATGGADGVGSAYSSTLLGSSLTWSSTSFNFGAANQLNGVRNATITLPSGQFGTLRILGTGINGDQTSQTVKVTYTDGTSSSFTQTFSNWLSASQNVAGQSTALSMAYRNKSTGVKDNRAFLLFGYSFALTSTKTVSSLTLPATNNVVILAATLSSGGATPTATATRTSTATATRTATPTARATPTPTSGTGITGDCGMDENGAGTGQVDYVEVYRSTYARWCVDNTFWPSNRAAISGFFAYYDGAVQELITVFNSQPTLPIVVEVTTPTGGACDCGPRFGSSQSVIITGDAYSNSFSNPQNGQAVPGFWGYLLTLHETINVWTGVVSAGWPTDWWADHRSPFPNSMDELIMHKIGTDQSNQTLLNAAATQHERFADPSISGYDGEVALFDNFFNQYGGFPTFSNFFKLIEGDGLQWGNVSANPSPLLSEYVMAYLSLAFGTTTDLTPTFVNAGVGTLDTTIAAYTVDSNAVRGVANAHCSIRAAAGAGVNVSSQLSQLQSGNYSGAMASGGTQSTCPAECRWSGSQCVAKW